MESDLYSRPIATLSGAKDYEMKADNILQGRMVEHVLLQVDPSGHANLIEMMSGLYQYSFSVNRQPHSLLAKSSHMTLLRRLSSPAVPISCLHLAFLCLPMNLP
jgi:hypothetical protein